MSGSTVHLVRASEEGGLPVDSADAVMSVDGSALGTVVDVSFDDSTGEILSLTNGSEDHLAAVVHSLGTYAVVVDR